jgi:hypothetical protein
MSFVFTEALRMLANKELGPADDLRALLVMTNTTVDSEEDLTNLAAFTTLDECDGAGYARVAFGGEVLNVDNANNRVLLDANDVTFPLLGAGTRPNQGLVLYKHVGADGVNKPIAFYDAAPFPVNGNGLDFIARVNALGLLALTA